MSDFSYVDRVLFDNKLIELGDWPPEIHSKLERWSKIRDYAMQNKEAASLISYLVLKLLDRDCDPRGKIRIKRLANSLANFERIIVSSRDLEKKFYRDHLNHILRVTLLARTIGKKHPFALSSEQLNMLILACLFHDIAYPLSKIAQCFNMAINAVKDCYNIASDLSETSDLILNLDAGKVSELLLMDRDLCKKAIGEFEHGILGALELISYLKDDKVVYKYRDAIRAIASHHVSSYIIKPSDRILSLLILADEMQDWGRPISYPAHIYAIPRIEGFNLKDNSLCGEFKTENIPSYSLLRQICAKSENLSRLDLPKDYSFTLKFSFSDFIKFNIISLEQELQALYVKCSKLEPCLFYPDHFTKLYVDNSPFENVFYGRSISRQAKLDLFKRISINQLLTTSPFRKMLTFINESANDILIIKNNMIKGVESLQLHSQEGRIRVEIIGDSSRSLAKITTTSKEANKLCTMLLAEMRFFNICIYKISQYLNKDYPVEVGFEDFPDQRDILSVQDFVGMDISRSSQLLPKIRNCIRSDGFFLALTSTLSS